MMKKAFFLLTVLWIFLHVPFIVAEEKTSANPVFSSRVILISMDGVRHDLPDKGRFAGLKRMETEGFRARKMLPVFPANTFPAHASLASGATPSVHGIIDNQFYDRQKGWFDVWQSADWFEAEPLWISVTRQQQRSAVYYWLGSESAWKGKTATYFETPFRAVPSEAEKVQQIVRWLDMPTDQRPHLMMSYWHGVDRIGHRFGPNHPEVIKQLQRQDNDLQRLQKAIDERKLWDELTLIVVSDHGMTEMAKYIIDLPKILSQNDINSRIGKSNMIANLYFHRSEDIAAGYQRLKMQKEFSTYYPHELPEPLRIIHPQRSGDLVLIANEGSRFSTASFYEVSKMVRDYVHQGMHGLHTEHPDMATIFLAQGRAIPKGSSLSEVHMLDVAATASALLGLEPPLQSTGKNIVSLLK